MKWPTALYERHQRPREVLATTQAALESAGYRVHLARLNLLGIGVPQRRRRHLLRFQYVADVQSRVGFCALWCEHCGHGHTLSRVRVPDRLDLLPLDAPDDVIRDAVPDFYDVALHESEPAAPSPAGSRIAALRPLVAEYGQLLAALAGRARRSRGEIAALGGVSWRAGSRASLSPRATGALPCR